MELTFPCPIPIKIGGGNNDDDAITETTAAAAALFREFLAACLGLNPDDRLTAAALVEEGSVGQAWFALAGNEVDIRWKGKFVSAFVVGGRKGNNTRSSGACQRIHSFSTHAYLFPHVFR